MCGIVGGISFGKTKFSKIFIEKLRDTMIHRGPDGCGTWISETKQIALAHRRLSIVDLSIEASQPMHDLNKRYVCVFNGEIYNHKSLREELIARGVSEWKTKGSDTEVVLNSYIFWGIDFIHKLHGIFSIAVWDSLKEELILIRDRIGVKPLYWSKNGDRLLFASEIKAILKDPNQKRTLNHSAVSSFLSFICVPSPQTLFEGINKLPPGCFLRVNKKKDVSEFRWYDPLDSVLPLDHLAESSIENKIEDTLSDSIQLRTMSDVPVGIFLSGGIDSSINAIKYKDYTKEEINTFTVGYEGQGIEANNELQYAKKIAQTIGSRHHELLISESDFISFIPEMIRLQDEPIADPVCMPVNAISRLAYLNGVKVCHVGEGADELFFGYPAWRYWYCLQLILNKFPFFSKSSEYLKCFSHKKPVSRFMEACSRFNSNQPIFWSTAEGPIKKTKIALFGEGLSQHDIDPTGWADMEDIWHRFCNHQNSKLDTLQWMTYAELSIRLPELLLMRVDKMSMGASVEGRVPFLDHKLVELALSISSRIRAKKLKTKPLLKNIFKDKLPSSIINRRKQGFGVPTTKWMNNSLGKKMRSHFEMFCSDTKIFDHNEILRIMNSNNSSHAWYLFNFVLWYRHFIEGISEKDLI